MQKAALVLLLALIAVPTSSAAHPATGQLTAADTDAAGDVVLNASLLAFTRFDLSVPEMAATPPLPTIDPGFQLRAHTLRIVTHQNDPTVRGPRGYVVMDPHSQERLFENAVVTGLQVRPEYRFDVYPLNGNLPVVEVSSNCAELRSSSRAAVGSEPKANVSAPQFTVDVSNAASWSECGQSKVTIIGSYVLVLWQWDSQVESKDETTELPSGMHRTSTVPEPAASALYPTVSNASQQYIYAEDAVLTIPRMDNTSHWAYLEAPQVTADTMRFTTVAGQIEQNGVVQPIQASSLNVAGRLDLQGIQSTGQDGSLQADLGGRLDSAQADGQPLSFAVAPASNKGGSFAWFLGLGAFGAVLVPAVPIVRVARQRRAIRANDRCKALTDIARFEQACREGELAVKRRPQDATAHANFARALGHLGRYDQAERHRLMADSLLGSSPSDPHLWVENAFQAAEEAATAGHDSRARKWLIQALRQQPSLIEDADCVPALRPIVDELTMRNGSKPADWVLP